MTSRNVDEDEVNFDAFDILSVSFPNESSPFNSDIQNVHLTVRSKGVLMNVMFKNEVKMVVNTLNFVLPSYRMFGHANIGRDTKENK